MKGKREKRPMFTGLEAMICQSSPTTRKSDIEFRRPLYIRVLGTRSRQPPRVLPMDG